LRFWRTPARRFHFIIHLPIMSKYIKKMSQQINICFFHLLKTVFFMVFLFQANAGKWEASI